MYIIIALYQNICIFGHGHIVDLIDRASSERGLFGFGMKLLVVDGLGKVGYGITEISTQARKLLFLKMLF